MGKSFDFVYMGGYCPSDGCPEHYFNWKSSFENKHVQEAFGQAMSTIRRYGHHGSTIPDSSPLKSESEAFAFLEKIRELEPKADDMVLLTACSHGKILFQKVVRFPRTNKKGL